MASGDVGFDFAVVGEFYEQGMFLNANIELIAGLPFRRYGSIGLDVGNVFRSVAGIADTKGKLVAHDFVERHWRIPQPTARSSLHLLLNVEQGRGLVGRVSGADSGYREDGRGKKQCDTEFHVEILLFLKTGCRPLKSAELLSTSSATT
jgi:hypothetical protein